MPIRTSPGLILHATRRAAPATRLLGSRLFISMSTTTVSRLAISRHVGQRLFGCQLSRVLLHPWRPLPLSRVIVLLTTPTAHVASRRAGITARCNRRAVSRRRQLVRRRIVASEAPTRWPVLFVLSPVAARAGSVPCPVP